MNFDIDKLREELNLGEEGLESLNFEACSVVTRNNERLLAWYYQIDGDRALIGFPYKVLINNRGELEKISRWDLLSEEIFFVVAIENLLSVSPMSRIWFPRFEQLVDGFLEYRENQAIAAEQASEESELVADEDGDQKKVLH